MHLPPLPHKIWLLIAAGAVVVGLLLYLGLRFRGMRDRRKIRLDLEKRRCKLVALVRTKTGASDGESSRPSRGRAYDVEFTELDGDTGQSTCRIASGGVHWNDDGVAPGLEIAASLPQYGQNWRG